MAINATAPREIPSGFLQEDIRLDMDAFYRMDSSVFEKCVEVGKKKTEIGNIIKLLKK